MFRGCIIPQAVNTV